MSNVSLLPWAGLIVGAYGGVKIYEHLCYEGYIQVQADFKMYAMAAILGVIGWILGFFFMVKVEEM